MSKISLSSKEDRFCRHLAQRGVAQEAEALSGYSRGRASELLAKVEISGRVNQLIEHSPNPQQLVKAGLQRLAFYSIADVVTLLNEGDDLSKEGLAQLDLFGVSGITRDKAGKLSVSLYDRQKALESLKDYSDSYCNNDQLSFFDALGASARAIGSED